MRSRVVSLCLSILLHAGLIGFAAGVVYTLAKPRTAIPVALLPGGGGGRPASEADPAKHAADPVAPVAAPPEKPRLEKRALALPSQRPPRAQPPPAAASAPSEAQPLDVAATAGDGGSGAGSGGGSGGRAGSGSGTGNGSGRGHDVDLRLFCVSCPEPLYPRLARVRGWEGATDIELVVLADGHVDDVALKRSSGFEVLDNAALDVARQSRFSPPPDSFTPPVRGRLAYRFELRSR